MDAQNDAAGGMSFGAQVRAERKRRGKTLSDLAKETGMSVSALSKIENDLVSPTFANLMRLAEGFGMHIAELVSLNSNRPIPSARLTVTRAEDRSYSENAHFSFAVLCGDLREKWMNPVINRVSPKPEDELGELVSHRGEEFVFVLSGMVEIRTEYYKPVALKKGDSLYMDSTMPHRYVALGDEPAEALVIWLPGWSRQVDNTGEEIDELAEIRRKYINAGEATSIER